MLAVEDKQYYMNNKTAAWYLRVPPDTWVTFLIFLPLCTGIDLHVHVEIILRNNT